MIGLERRQFGIGDRNEPFPPFLQLFPAGTFGELSAINLGAIGGSATGSAAAASGTVLGVPTGVVIGVGVAVGVAAAAAGGGNSTTNH